MGYKADKFRSAVSNVLSSQVKEKVSGEQGFFDSALSNVARKFEDESLSAEDATKEIVDMLKKFSVYISGSSDERALKKALDTLIRSL